MIKTNTKYSYEHANEATTTVAGETYIVWDNFMMRGTFAQNKAGEIKQIKFRGYVSKDLSVRKAIQAAFNLDTFRK